MFYATFMQMKKTLGQLEKWLEIATTNAQARSFDANVLLSARLAPDQFPLTRQVQTACDTAKLGASRLTGKPAPKHEDNENSIDELRARVSSVISYLDTYTEQDFEGAATRSVTQPRWEGKSMTGHDYFLEHNVPNFFFHVTIVYAILRHNGIPLGKRDYLGQLSLK
jgi:hypothetical protein